METTTFTAPDITCEGCAAAIKRTLGKIPGVTAVEVDVDAKGVEVRHEPGVARAILVERLDRAGFPVE